MNYPQQSRSGEVAADYTGVLRRRWWIVVGLTCLGLIGAFIYAKSAPKKYTSTAAVYVTPTGADQSNQLQNSRTSGSVNLDTEAQVVQSSAVAAMAGHMLHSPLTPYQLSKSVGATVPPNSAVLSINCSAPSATAAAACANAFAKAYLDYRSTTAKNAVAAQIHDIQGTVSSLQGKVAALQVKMSTLPSNSPQRSADSSQLGSDQNQLHQLTGHLATLQGQGASSSGGYIITNASPPGKPSSPKLSLVLPAGLVSGLIVGLIAAFLWDRRDRRIYSAQAVERGLDLPVLASLPRLGASKHVSLASPRSRTGRAFTELAQNVTAALGEGNHVIMVTGASGGAVGVVASNLAVTLARTHSEAVLICADMDDAMSSALFGFSDVPGLAELLTGSATVQEVARQRAEAPGLWVVTPGVDTAQARYFVKHDIALRLVGQLRKDVRYVVIEAPALGGSAETFALAEFADAALLTVELSRTTQLEAADCLQRLRLMHTPALGAAVLPALTPGSTAAPPPRQEELQPEFPGGQPRRGGSAEARTERSKNVRTGQRDGLDQPVRSGERTLDSSNKVHGS